MLIAFIDLLGFGIVIPLLPYYALRFQASDLAVTLLASVFSLCQFISSPILGVWSDRIGRKPVLIFSQWGSAIGYIVLAMATEVTWPTHTIALGVIFLSRVIDGLTAGNITVVQAYVGDRVAPKNRAKVVGMIGAAFGVGFALGPLIGGVLGHYNPAYPAFLSAILSMIASIMVWRFLPESKTDGTRSSASGFVLAPSRLATLRHQPMVVWLTATWFCCMFGFVMLEPTIPLLLEKQFGYGAREAGYFYFFVGATICFIQGGLIGPLNKRFGEWQLAFAGAVLAMLGMFGYAYVAYAPAEISPGKIVITSLFLVLGTSAIMNAVGRSLQMPTMSAMLSHNSDPKSQGAAFGMFQGFASLARVFGPLLAGVLLQTFTRSWWVMFVVAAGWLGLASVLLLLLRSRLKFDSAEIPPDPAVAAAEGVA